MTIISLKIIIIIIQRWPLQTSVFWTEKVGAQSLQGYWDLIICDLNYFLFQDFYLPNHKNLFCMFQYFILYFSCFGSAVFICKLNMNENRCLVTQLETAHVKVTTDLMHAASPGLGLIPFDLIFAFDKVPHDIKISLLKNHAGISDVSLICFLSYRTDLSL